MQINKWLFAALLVLAAHFAASYLVPLDKPSQATFGGLLRWAWPWADGDSGPLGTMTVGGGFPVSGFFLAMVTAGIFILSALAVVGLWVPYGWWRPLATIGSVLSLALMVLFFGPTKLLPIAADIAILAALVGRWSPAAAQ
jgi:hypothetical protein